MSRRKRGPRREIATSDQALISPSDWRRPGVRLGVGAAQAVLLIGLAVIGLGPLLWLAKSAITPTTDTITTR